MSIAGKRVGAISLGCDKNRVDTERMLGILMKAGCEIVSDPAEAEIIVVNTCAFLESARAEAIDEILDCASYRERGRMEKLVVTGCLPQKFVSELYGELPEVDVFLGFRDYDALPSALEAAYRGERVDGVGENRTVSEGDRVLTTPLHYAYLKIADGCDNKCTYCLIPSIRGKYVSEPMEKLVREAQALGELSELILVAQDTTRYGEDLYGENRFVALIRALSALPNVSKIRLLYCYPDRVSGDLIEELKNNPKLIKYLDIPLQHADAGVLKRMNRKGTGAEYLALISKLRKEVPGISIRSTFIAGFPGEDEGAANALADFLRSARFNYAGFFAYSREAGTPAAKLPDQIAEKTKEARVRGLYAVQAEITEAFLSSLIGRTVPVVFDGIDYDRDLFYGHADFQCPGLDGTVYFTSAQSVEQGHTYGVRIERTDNFDLYGGIQ